MEGAYNGTLGFVHRPASKQRAVNELPTLSARLNKVLGVVTEADLTGATWQEVAGKLGLHHGQASGALSNLHKLGLVFTTLETRGRCHIYYGATLRGWFDISTRFDEPAQTKAGRENMRLRHIADMAALALQENFTPETVARLRAALNESET